MVIKTVPRTRQVTAAQLRSLTGFNAARDIADGDLEAAIDRAQAAVVGMVSDYVFQLPLAGPVDGSNTRFQVHPQRLNRVLLDANLDLASDADDVEVVTRDGSTDPPTYATVAVSSVAAEFGEVVLSVAPEAGLDVLLTGRLVGKPLDLDRVQNCIAYYAAYLVSKSATRSGKVNLTNPQAENKDEAAPRTNWMHLFLQEMRFLARAHPRAATTRTHLPGGDRIDAGRYHAP